eukprot:600961-Rhodomonas_salina.1
MSSTCRPWTERSHGARSLVSFRAVPRSLTTGTPTAAATDARRPLESQAGGAAAPSSMRE